MSKNSKWRLPAILNYYLAILDHPRSFLVAYVQIWCVSDLYLRRYPRSNISQVWLKMPISAPKIYVLGGFWPLNITFHHRDLKRHFLGGKHVLWAIARRNRSSGVARTRCEEWTRKLCYRKDDRAMRPTYGFPENFRDSLTTSTATILNISWAFVPVDPMNVPTKFENRSFTRCWDNRGYPKNLGSPWIRPSSVF